jgi:hypothetical protein
MNHRVLQPGVHLLSRPDGSLQVGINPRRSIVIPAPFAPSVQADVSRGECPGVIGDFLTPTVEYAADLDPLLRLNQSRHPVAQAHMTQVRIHGAGRLGTTIALLLAGSGLPHIRMVDPKPVAIDDVTPWGASRVDVGARRDQTCAAIMERVRRDASHKQLHPEHAERLLVVLAPDQRADWPWVDVSHGDEWLSRDTPHLVATTAGEVGAVSHVIEPGVTACLRCAFEAKTDADPAWPLLDAQLRTKPDVDTAPLPLVLATALVAVERVTAWLHTGDHGDIGMTYVPWPAAATTRDAWAPHPACGCAWANQGV